MRAGTRNIILIFIGLIATTCTRNNLTTCQQDVFATGLWQACQQVVTMLQVATRLSLTTC
jgi:hypothetical protein